MGRAAGRGTLDGVNPTLVYDGDCGICDASVRFLSRQRVAVHMVPSRTWLLDHPDDAARTAAAVLFVDTDGSELDGERAIAAVLRRGRAPLPWAGAVIDAPGVRHLSAWVYRLVADHRAWLSSRLGLTACAIPDRGPGGA